jgi:hypothetical protein
MGERGGEGEEDSLFYAIYWQMMLTGWSGERDELIIFENLSDLVILSAVLV